MRALERYLLLQIIDQRWREHLYDMDYLREGIHLRGFAQIEPLVAYKNEAFTLFQRPDEHDLVGLRAHDLQRRGRGRAPRTAARRSATRPTRRPRRAAGSVSYSGLAQAQQGALAMAAAAGAVERAAEAYGDGELDGRRAAAPVEQRRVDEDEQIGRNDPCWCGSGKKFKKCHGA